MNDPVGLSLRQFIAAWRLICAPSPDRVMAAEDGIEYVFSGLPVAFFNAAFVASRGASSDRLAGLGRRAIEWVAMAGVPWMFLVTEESAEPGVDVVAVLDGCGLAPVMSLFGMLAEKVAPIAAVPARLELEVPRDDAGCGAIVDVNSAAYAMDLSGAKGVLGRAAFWSDKFPVLGRVGGRPVCCTATFMVDDLRYVAWVATEPGEQRKGYADAAMRRSLELAARVHGERPTFLHATEAGRPVYERMGYTQLATHTVFMEKRLLEGHD